MRDVDLFLSDLASSWCDVIQRPAPTQEDVLAELRGHASAHLGGGCHGHWNTKERIHHMSWLSLEAMQRLADAFTNQLETVGSPESIRSGG